MTYVHLGLMKSLTDTNSHESSILNITSHLNKELLDIGQEEAIKGSQGACLIFVHAGLNACLDSVAECSVQAEPEVWISKLSDKKIKVSDLIVRGKDKIIQELIREYINSFERFSLCSKANILLSIFKPKSQNDSFKFSQEKLGKIDKIRHGCAHGRIGVVDFSTFKSDLSYLIDTGSYFIQLGAKKYSLNIGT